MRVSPGLCLDCVWENICSAIATVYKHYKLHNTHKGCKVPKYRERERKINSAPCNRYKLVYVQSDQCI